MKRKADVDAEVEDGTPLFKSLRKSISDFLHANDVSELVLTKRDLLAQDPEDERWAKYRERLATFPTMVKLSGAKEISPAVCASHGWTFHDRNFLQCADCRQVLCISLPEALAISIRIMRSCIRNIQRKLNESHALNCRWRTSNGLNLFTPPYNICWRYEALECSPLNVVPLAEGVIDAHVLATFPTLTDRFRLVVAICGWMPAMNGSVDRLDCLLCGRELCLSVFTAEQPLNPLEQHYAYCPVADKELPIWKEAVNAVTAPTKKEKEPLVSQLSRIKSMLGYIFKK